MKEADLLVLGTPSYWGNLPAPLRAVFDRNVPALVHTGGIPLSNMTGKKALLLLTCGNNEARGGLAAEMPLLAANLRNILQSGGYEIIDTIEIFSSWDREKTERWLPARIRELELC